VEHILEGLLFSGFRAADQPGHAVLARHMGVQVVRYFIIVHILKTK
jgi:hypothetical protein